MKQSRKVNFENFPLALTMGAPMCVTIYVKTRSLLQNGSHQKWLHEALAVYLVLKIEDSESICLKSKSLLDKSLVVTTAIY